MTDRAADASEKGPSPEKKSRFLDLGPGWISAITGVVAVILTGVGLLVSNAGGGSPTTNVTTPPANNQTHVAGQAGTILPPADLPAKVAICSVQVEDGADGNVGPLTCANGALNELAWDALASNHPLVMSLGPNVLPDQVLQAMCSDLQHGSTNTLETSVYQISALYYHWQFGVDPAQEIPDACSSGG